MNTLILEKPKKEVKSKKMIIKFPTINEKFEGSSKNIKKFLFDIEHAI